MEKRYVVNNDLQFRFETNEDGKSMLVGYALLYNTPSAVLYDANKRKAYTEVIQRGAIDPLEEKAQDVVLTYNHDEANILARSTSGTLHLTSDETGLFFRAELPDTMLGRDVATLVKRGDLRGASFAFTMRPEDMTWQEREGKTFGYIKNIRQLYDVAVVVRPAYPAAEFWSRSETAADSYLKYQEDLEAQESEAAKAEAAQEAEKRGRNLQLLKLKIRK
jgi:HK97 family phage prohead protease